MIHCAPLRLHSSMSAMLECSYFVDFSNLSERLPGRQTNNRAEIYVSTFFSAKRESLLLVMMLLF